MRRGRRRQCKSSLRVSTCLASTTFPGRVDSSLLLPSATRCLMKNVTRRHEREGWQIEEAIERGNETGTD